MAKKKAELIEEAKAAGVEVPASKTVPEIKEILAEAVPTEPDLDAADATVPGDPENAPDSIKELAAFDDPKAPLAHTPSEGLTEYRDLREVDEGVKVDASGANPPPPEVARGPLPGTPPDGFREDYFGPPQVVGPGQPVNTDPHLRGGTDTKPDQEDASRAHAQEKANAPGVKPGDKAEIGEDTHRPEDGDGEKDAPEREDDAPTKTAVAPPPAKSVPVTSATGNPGKNVPVIKDGV